jgi:hypothetical protein
MLLDIHHGKRDAYQKNLRLDRIKFFMLSCEEFSQGGGYGA